MNIPKTVYWLVTIPVALVFSFSAYMSLKGGPEYMEMWRNFGFPDYIPAVHGPLKALAVIGLLIPRTSFLKHWIYAGMAFNLLLAGMAHCGVGESIMLQSITAVLLFVSYYLYMNKMDFKELVA